ncbi:MAG: YggS family pyridoxal phosphate-dependent enzyme [Nitrospirota bacterium]|nr:YggS family pyridoxal phosphate-dependent enzyme [Nitrospirota bacterium]
MKDFAARLTALRARIESAARRSGRPAQDITLLAVSKTFPAEAVREALVCGLSRFGESRIQEALPKMEAVGSGPEWHFIGHLQRNKVNRAVGAFALIHSVDSLALAERIDFIAGERGVVQPLLIEVNAAREAQKNGVAVEQAEALARAIGRLPHLRLTGLMGMAPYSDDPERARPVFRELAGLFHHIARQGYHGVQMQTLSMGMSGDFEVAVEEGATLVRVGGALFGERNRGVA